MNNSEFPIFLFCAVWVGLALLADYMYDPSTLQVRGVMSAAGQVMRLYAGWIVRVTRLDEFVLLPLVRFLRAMWIVTWVFIRLLGLDELVLLPLVEFLYDTWVFIQLLVLPVRTVVALIFGVG